MITPEQCEAIWPLGWTQSKASGELYSNSCRWLFRVELVEDQDLSVVGYLNGVLWSKGNLRDVLAVLQRSLRERYSATDQTVPPLRQMPMLDRLSALLCPKGWEHSSGALVFNGPLGHLVIRHEAGALDILPLGGGRVHTVALNANASDDEVEKALAELLSFPRYP